MEKIILNFINRLGSVGIISAENLSKNFHKNITEEIFKEKIIEKVSIRIKENGQRKNITAYKLNSKGRKIF